MVMIPDKTMKRLNGVDADGQMDEGINICVEQIEKLKENLERLRIKEEYQSLLEVNNDIDECIILLERLSIWVEVLKAESVNTRVTL